MTLAEELLTAVGGAANVVALTRCWARLRFEVHDPSAVDEARVQSLPDVAIAVHQHGQYQVALRAGLLETYDDLIALMNRYDEREYRDG